MQRIVVVTLGDVGLDLGSFFLTVLGVCCERRRERESAHLVNPCTCRRWEQAIT